MQTYEDNMFARGLSFFGRANRLISHEMKNVLAIISETTHLMDELIELSEEGTDLPPGRLRALARSILEDIDRANEIVRSMNTFAHGVDTIYGEVDVGRTIEVMLRISKMHAAAKKTQVDFPGHDPHTIFTIPFILQNLLYESLSGLLSGAKTELRITVAAGQDCTGIRMEGGQPEFGNQFIEDKAPFFRKTLAADIDFDPVAKAITITLPNRIEDRSDA